MPGKKFWFSFCVVLALLVAMGGSPRWAHAATFSVNDSGDAGDANPGDGICATAAGKCTLRAAIDETNRLTGPNTINIPAMTIVINSELRIYDDVGDDSVIINGAGRDVTIIDGNYKTRVFYFTARSGNHAISNLTIRNARNPNTAERERNGGGIFNEAVLTLTNVRVTNSTAYSGGGIYNEFDYLTTNYPTLTLNSVILDHNSATGSTLGAGGGLFNGCIVAGTDVTISDNTANSQGGGWYNDSYRVSTMTNFEISRNTALMAAGINDDLGEVHLRDGRITANRTTCCAPGTNASGGAGIYNNLGTMYITNVLIRDNVADSPGGFGGGIYNLSHMTLINVAVINNRAAYGAGIYNGWSTNQWSNSLKLVSVTISGNVGVSTPPVDAVGGGLYEPEYGKVEIYSSTITNNSARIAGGIYKKSTTDYIRLYDSILYGNRDEYGSGDCWGRLQSGGYNIIGNPTGSSSFPCTFLAQSTDRLRIDPLLSPLIEAFLPYHRLLSGSPAWDAADRTRCPPTDQLGVPRPIGASCEIGAIEMGPLRQFIPLVLR